MNGLVQQLQQLEKYDAQQIPSLCFFKPAQRQQTLAIKEQLQSLQSSLIVNLNSYPKFIEEEDTKLSYVSSYHQQCREHHVHVSEIAQGFNKVFDEYVCHLNSESSESNRLLVV